MYERFTDRARKVMQLANRQAQEWNHEYIGPEHLLAALAAADDGIAYHVLRKLTPGGQAIIHELEQRIPRGPEMISVGKLPQTPRCKSCIGWAIEESRYLAHPHVGTEHILLGLLLQAGGCNTIDPVDEVLCLFGLTVEAAREAVLELVSSPANMIDAAMDRLKAKLDVWKPLDGRICNQSFDISMATVASDDLAPKYIDGLLINLAPPPPRLSYHQEWIYSGAIESRCFFLLG